MSNKFSQTHFEIIRVTVPSVTGACTIGSSAGFGTPLTCDQVTNDETIYSFASEYSPLIPENNVFKCIKSISETPTKLESGKGLSSRGTMSLLLKDFDGDPNKDSPAVLADSSIIKQGTYLGKWNERNILANRNITVEYHTEEDYPTPVQTRTYLTESMQDNGNGTWSLRCKDVMSAINFDEYQFPSNDAGFLRLDIDDTTTTIPVDTNPYAIDDVILTGEEFMRVTGVSNIGTGSATVTVQTRGTPIVFTEELTRTSRDSHSAGDAVFNCTVSNNQRIDDFIELLLLDADIDPVLIANSKPGWTTEVDEWQSGTRINTLWYKQEDGNEVLASVMTDYLMDIWFDPTDNLIKISAISQWKTSNSVVEEGKQITYDTFKYVVDDNLRATRAYAVYDKSYLSRSDDIESFARLQVFNDSILEDSDYYGKPKAYRFPNSRLLDDGTAALLVKRYVNRFGLAPKKYSWMCEERFLDFKTGDVVDLRTPELQSITGLQNTNTRAQILSIKPKYAKVGREYAISAITYSPEFTDSDIIYRNFPEMQNVNLYDEAGRPNEAVDLTFVFDGVKIGSSDRTVPSMVAGNFVAGSTLTIIFIGGTDLQSKGGDGGSGGSSELDQESGTWLIIAQPTAGTDAGSCFDDNGIDCTIYLSGPTGNVTYPTADGYIRAGGGGGGATSAANEVAGDGGGGGAGVTIGFGGNAGTAFSPTSGETTGKSGKPSDEQGNGGLSNGSGGKGGNWGQDGNPSQTPAGIKGKGLAGLLTTLIGATASRFINGGGNPSL